METGREMISDVEPAAQPDRDLPQGNFAANPDAVRRLLAEGRTAGEIAKKLRVQTRSIYAVIRKYDDLELNKPKDPLAGLPRIGATRPAMTRQPAAFLKWLGDSAPEGASLSEFLVSCAVDAWHEEEGTSSSAREASRPSTSESDTRSITTQDGARK